MKKNNSNFFHKNNVILNPDFVTGLTDAEGCFSVNVRKDDTAKLGINVNLRFKIAMLENETELLEMVKSFFGCGTLSHYKDGTAQFVINDFSSIKNKVIPHFLKYPLRGTKYLDFISFKNGYLLMDKKEHLTKEGIDKLYKIKEGMNTGREYSNNVYYSPSHTKDGNKDYIPINGHYVNGFIAGDGCLYLNLNDKHFGDMRLQISQHINNRLLMVSIANYFKSSLKIYQNKFGGLQVSLSGIKLWENTIFKHFLKYPIYGTKNLRLNKLLMIRELKVNNNHLLKIGGYKKWKPDYKLRIIDI